MRVFSKPVLLSAIFIPLSALFSCTVWRSYLAYAPEKGYKNSLIHGWGESFGIKYGECKDITISTVVDSHDAFGTIAIVVPVPMPHKKLAATGDQLINIGIDSVQSASKCYNRKRFPEYLYTIHFTELKIVTPDGKSYAPNAPVPDEAGKVRVLDFLESKSPIAVAYFSLKELCSSLSDFGDPVCPTALHSTISKGDFAVPNA